MAHPSTLFRFRIELSDIDRGVYETLDFRIAQHPSENIPFLLTRVFAFALNSQPDLEFSPGGLADPDAPCIQVLSPNGGRKLWIEIGNPSARKLHKAAKSSDVVKVYTYKDAENLMRDMESEKVHKAEQIDVFSLPQNFLNRLGDKLERDNRWSVVHHEGALTVTLGDFSESEELRRHTMRTQ